MQLMPGTAALMGVRDSFDPEQNIAGGVRYLRGCLDRFGHNVPLAVAAYNAGPEAVAKYCTIPPYQETQLFVNNVMGTYGAYGGNAVANNPAGQAVLPWRNQPPKSASQARCGSGKRQEPPSAQGQDHRSPVQNGQNQGHYHPQGLTRLKTRYLTPRRQKYKHCLWAGSRQPPDNYYFSGGAGQSLMCRSRWGKGISIPCC